MRLCSLLALYRDASYFIPSSGLDERQATVGNHSTLQMLCTGRGRSAQDALGEEHGGAGKIAWLGQLQERQQVHPLVLSLHAAQQSTGWLGTQIYCTGCAGLQLSTLTHAARQGRLRGRWPLGNTIGRNEACNRSTASM